MLYFQLYDFDYYPNIFYVPTAYKLYRKYGIAIFLTDPIPQSPILHPCYENNGVTDFDASGCHFSSTTLAWLLYGSIPVFIRIF